MNRIRVAYSPLINAGDALNFDLIHLISGKDVIRSKVYNADMMAIGGALFGAQYSDGVRGVLQKGVSLVYGNKPLYVWGSGFLRANSNNPMYRRNLIVCALRGQKTQEKLSQIMNKKYDVLLADPGLLIDLLLDKPVEKKYGIGIIPHFSQQEEQLFVEARNNPNIHFIDIKQSPKKVVQDIAACSTIASSSLHGLIFADSLHIPSLRLIGQTELPGGDFKFVDYYSSYGLKDNPWLNHSKIPTENDIVDNCHIDYSVVEQKKSQLLNSFPNVFK